jgi:Gas vesicle synthesis protein GvpL/GvpF
MAAERGWYVYGIVEPEVELVPDTPGVGDPPGAVEIVDHGRVSALVSPLVSDHPLGRDEDLRAHQEILDATAAEVPVLPLRFGAVLSSREAVVEELLAPHEDEFAAALSTLAGEAQYVLRARYDESALMREILAANPEAAALREQLIDRDPATRRPLELRLGELVNAAVEAKRAADTQAVIDAVEPVAVSVSIRPPTDEEDAAHVAMLVERSKEPDLEGLLGALAEDWQGRAAVRLLGPMAPYDFVVTNRSQ